MRIVKAFVICIVLTFGAQAYAAEHCKWYTDHLGGGLYITKVDWKAAADGTLTATTIDSMFYDGTNSGAHMQNTAGYMVMAITDPGTTAPADNYEVILQDAYSVLIFGTALDALDTANSEDWEPDIAYRPFEFPWTFDQESAGGANNANCEGIAYFLWKKAE